VNLTAADHALGDPPAAVSPPPPTSAAPAPSIRPATPPTTPTTASPSEGRSFVQVAIAASDEDALALVDTLRELVGRLGLGLQSMRSDAPPWSAPTAPRPRDERARIWVDERAPDRVTVVVSSSREGASTSPVERVVPRGETSTITTEEVAHVVHATLESLLATEGPAPESAGPKTARDMPPPAPSSSTPPPGENSRPATPPPARGIGLDLAGFVTGRQWGAHAGPIVGGGGAVDVGLGRGRWRPELWVSGAYDSAFASQSSEVTLQTSITSIRAVPGVAFSPLRVLQVGFGAGAGIDVLSAVPRDPAASVELTTAKTVVDPVFTGLVSARIRILSFARLIVGAEVDYDFAAHRYTAIGASGNPVAVLEPWLVRPSAMIGLCVPLAGAVACGGPE
jgi:hypothetical protein